MDATARRSVVTGLAKLADAVHDLRKAERSIERAAARAGRPVDEEMANGLSNVLGHLSEAVAGVTPAMWALMLSEREIGLDEVRKALNAAA